MCLATVYLEQEGGTRELMRDVSFVRFDREGVLLGQFLGPERRFPLRLKSVDLLNSAVLLTAASADEDPLDLAP